jgi:hypothetical protein
MRFFTFICILLISFLLSCKNSTDTSSGYTNSDGLIIGADPRMCICCGGWYVDINKDTLRIWNMPDDFNKILSTKKLPVAVNLTWERMTDGCGASMKDIILVDSIKLK